MRNPVVTLPSNHFKLVSRSIRASMCARLPILRASRGGTAELVVRVPWNDAVVIERLPDTGFRSFMIPLLQSAEETRSGRRHAAVGS
jgi:2-keto-3-deoxy-L-rhamnonate aldolase RhmA